MSRLNERIIACEACPRLRRYCMEVAATKRRMYQDWDYWGKPVPNFGDANARILIIGLAPAAHGANRTGRMFCGDQSGNWLFRALHDVGLANQPTCESSADSLRLTDVLITASAHCAPPANKPTLEELRRCRPFLLETMAVARNWRVLVALGRIGFEQTLTALKEANLPNTVRRSHFSHGAELELPEERWIVCSYHPSQQNTFTGKLTREMLTSVFRRARELAGGQR